nr:MAG TPA: hypothetical protein [Caudoviricetes sp.]
MIDGRRGFYLMHFSRLSNILSDKLFPQEKFWK